MKNNNFIKNAFYNSIRRVAAIVFPLISFSYSSRILGAEGIGKISYTQSIVSYFSLLAALGIYDYAVREGAALRDNKKKLDTFIKEIFSINCITAIIAFILLTIIIIISELTIEYKILLFIHGSVIPLTAMGAEWINNIYEEYRYLSIRYIVIQVISIILMFCFVRSVDDIYIYAFLIVFSGYFGNIINWVYLKKNNIKLKFTFKINANTHLVPVMVLFASSLAAVIYLNSDITLLGILVDEQSVGVYSASTRIYNAIKHLINAVVMVTVPRFSYILSNGSLDMYKKELKKVFELLTIILAPIVLGLFLIAEKALYIVAGAGYESGASVVRILSLTIPFAVVACIMSYSILIPNHKEKHFFRATIIAAVFNVSLNFIFIPLLGINGAAMTTLIAEMIICLLATYYSKEWLKDMKKCNNILSVVIAIIPILVIHFIIDSLVNNIIVSVFLTMFFGASAYVIMLVILKNTFMISIVTKLKNRVLMK